MSGPAPDRSIVESLLELTRRMATAAAEADWDQVAVHDAERRALLEDDADAVGIGPSTPSPPALIDALREADRDVLARACEARAALGEHTSRTRAERDVCRTYADVMKSVGSCGAGG